MVEIWDDFLKHLADEDDLGRRMSSDELITDMYELIKFEKKEIGEVHSLSLRVHTLQATANQLFFGEGLFEAEELIDWTVEMIYFLETEEDKAMHFILELEAAEKEGKKWICKHHNKILTEVEVEKLNEDHFIIKVKKELKKLINIFHEIEEDLSDSDKQRIGALIQVLIHGLEHLIS